MNIVGERVIAWTEERSGLNALLDEHGTITRQINDHHVWVRWDSDGVETTYRLADLIKEMPS